MEHVYDVAVVGAGPSGASCAYWLASQGRDVCAIEKKVFPRVKTCGDGLTPRAVAQLNDMGLADELKPHHFYRGLRAWGFGHMLELPWPDDTAFPAAGYTVTRHDLDQMVANNATKAGATLLQGTEVAGVLRDGGHVSGVEVRESGHDDDRPSRPGPGGDETARSPAAGPGTTRTIRARYVVVADGANSRIGRDLGAHRRKEWPQGMAIRGYWESPRHDDPWIESHLDITGDDGTLLPGYGWVFPLGDGRVNLGVGLLDTNRHTHGGKAVNTTKLLDAFLRQVGRSWEIDVDRPCAAPTGGRLPMGLAVGPRSGPGYLMVGDAAGTINPFNGEGISYAYESGRMAATCVGRALDGGGSAALSHYDAMVEDTYGPYYRLGRAFVRIIGHPAVMRACVGTGMRSKPIMDVVMRVMANLLRPDGRGVAETAVSSAYALERLKDLVTAA